MQLKQLNIVEIILIHALTCVVSIYFYYFILIPQNWTLMDDYSFVRHWGVPGVDHWKLAQDYVWGLLKVGRFNPMDAFSRVLHYRYLPIDARIFHVSYFALASLALTFFAQFLRRFSLNCAQILFALLLVMSNLAFKDWLVKLTVSEGLATTFLFGALVLFTSQYLWVKWLGALIFPLSFFSKESFFLFAGLFPLIEFFEWKSKEKRGIVRLFPTILILVFTVTFVLFVKGLPRQYTSDLSFSKISLLPLLKSLILPPLKSFGPAFLLVGFSVLKQRGVRLNPQQIFLLAMGAYIVTAYSLFMNAWGSFDSWYYLHTVIPFGWALILAVLWRPSSVLSNLEYALLGLSFIYFLLSTTNGSRNYTEYFETSKTVADLACEDANRIKNLKIYTNCYEGSTQLENYLLLKGQCTLPTQIQYLSLAQELPSPERAPYEILISKYCDPFALNGLPKDYELIIGPWTVLKKF